MKKSKEQVHEVGILALQGDFDLHRKALARLNQIPLLVKTSRELAQIRRLIIPGGETTTLNRLIELYGLREPLIAFGRKYPIWGTCAGMIMLAQDGGDARIKTLRLIDLDVARNAYGRQIHSFSKTGEIILGNKSEEFPMVFIRAPKVMRIGSNVKVLGRLDDQVVMARENNILVSAFHPELTDRTTIHGYFMAM